MDFSVGRVQPGRNPLSGEASVLVVTALGHLRLSLGGDFRDDVQNTVNVLGGELRRRHPLHYRGFASRNPVGGTGRLHCRRLYRWLGDQPDTVSSFHSYPFLAHKGQYVRVPGRGRRGLPGAATTRLFFVHLFSGKARADCDRVRKVL